MTAFDNRQETLTLNSVVQTLGNFPSGSGGSGTELSMGTIHTYAFSFNPGGADTGDTLIPIASNPALFSLVGTTYGGDGRTTFGLPDLSNRLAVGSGDGPGLTNRPVGQEFGSDTIDLALSQTPTSVGGGGQSYENSQASTTITYAINTGGTFPNRSGGSTDHGFLGEVNAFANVSGTSGLPSGWVEANGQILDIATNQALFSILGTQFGGDGRTTFGLPDLRGRAIVGSENGTVGDQFGSETTTLNQNQLPPPIGNGQSIDNQQPTLELNYLIALTGLFPTNGSGNGGNTSESFIGEITAFAGNFAPNGFAFASGQLLSIAQNTALFAVLGTTFGGDGMTTFALPDLRGRSILDESTGNPIGTVLGDNDLNLVTANIPPLPPIVSINNTAPDVNEGADIEIGSGSLDTNDADTTDANLTYTLDNSVTNGTLYLDNDGSNTFNAGDTELNMGDTFTQQDIVDGNLRYEHNGGETTTDTFQFDVTDGTTSVDDQTDTRA